jgi:H+-transporting ATPase
MELAGLTSEAAVAWERTHGYNEITEKKESLARKILRRSISPISGMLFVAAGLSYVSGKSFDGSFILILLALNVGVTVWQEHKADTAIEKLNEHLAVAVKTLRDGAWRSVPSRELVPGDVVEIAAGGVVPADAAILEATHASANEAALTGESLPKEKAQGDPLYSGSFLATGLVRAKVSAVGSGTYFGKTLAKVDTTPKKSALERDILRISRFLSLLAIGAVLLLSAALLYYGAPGLELAKLDLSLVIAGIPISLPTVMTLIIAFGVVALAKKNVVVRRLPTLEELANTDLLLTDKTGTLTENRIEVGEVVAGERGEAEALRLAALVARQEPEDAINRALLAKAGGGALPERVLEYVPADSARKRATLVFAEGGRPRVLVLGAPQVVLGLSELSAMERGRFTRTVERFAERGYRTLALASAPGEKEEQMTLLGLFALSDTLRPDAAETVQFLAENGIQVAMVTGDNRAIAREVAHELALPGSRIIGREELLAEGAGALSAEEFTQVQAFAEILPEDKLALVERARAFYTVAAEGDGVNDLPAVRAASVGFAVANAVDALKGAADIVLLSSGIGVMKDAFIEGRKIFARLYTYSLYRISESFRLIVTIVVLGLATGSYPLTPLELILLALLNDIPIISLATDRVKIAARPAKINVRHQFTQSILYGLVGVANSLILFFLARDYFGLPLPAVETLFFLKLTVSGHLLIYVAHTKERWWRFLPSGAVIAATAATQALATLLALTGWLMPSAISWQLALFIWAWSFFFMQVSELVKRPGGR